MHFFFDSQGSFFLVFSSWIINEFVKFGQTYDQLQCRLSGKSRVIRGDRLSSQNNLWWISHCLCSGLPLSLVAIIFTKTKISFEPTIKRYSIRLCALYSDKLKAPLGLFFYNSSLRRVKKKDASSEKRPTFLHSSSSRNFFNVFAKRAILVLSFFNCEWNCKNERD